MFFFLTNSAQHRIVNSKKVFQTPEDQNLFDFDPAKSGNVTSLEPLARFSSPPFLKMIFWKSFYGLISYGSFTHLSFGLQGYTLSKLLYWFHLWKSFYWNLISYDGSAFFNVRKNLFVFEGTYIIKIAKLVSPSLKTSAVLATASSLAACEDKNNLSALLWF